ncbi:MAG: hypothetical protein C4555_00190 [Dehalococcoidia bacterium]|nr:MAG: hypothetical protein C4555_00190 [Dehalococcoidia bacterium]
MKRIIGLTLALLLMIGIIGAGTLAAYRNTEPSPNNAFAAGTLNLIVNGVDDGVGIAEFTVTNANPGQTGAGTWTLVNAGDLAGYIDTENITVTNAENYNAATDQAEAVDDADTSDLTGGGELAANMDVVLFVDDGAGTPANANNGVLDAGEVTIYSGKLSGIASAYDQNLALAAGATTYISMTWSVALAVDNTIMGDSATLDLIFELAQTTGQ